MKKQALLIVDVQNDYFPGGNMELHEAEQAACNIARVLRHCREKQIPAIHIQHLATGADATFFLPHTDGANIHEAVLPLASEKVITKHYPNSFRETDLLQYLQDQDITSLMIAGMMTHVCIDATVRAAKDQGFHCLLLSDCCATRQLELNDVQVEAQDVQNAFMAALAFYYAEVRTSSEYLNAMV